MICSPTGRIHKIREGEWLQVARKESWAITSQQKRVNKEDGSWVGYKFSNLVQVLYYPALFQNSIKQYHYLGTKCSDIQAYGSMFLFKTPQELMALYKNTMLLKKEIIRTSGGYSTVAWLWITLIPIAPTQHCWPQAKVGTCESRLINGILGKVWFMLGTTDLWTHPVVISPVSEWIIGIYILRNWQHSHIGSLTYDMRAIMVGKVKWKL